MIIKDAKANDSVLARGGWRARGATIMIPLGVRIAAFLSVPMVAATSASAEEKKKAAPPQSRQSSVMFDR
jgi:hypothetical protein